MSSLFSTPPPSGLTTQEASTFSEQLMEAKLLYQAISKGERDNLHNAYKLGGVLCKLKTKTPFGQWIPRLKELGISRTSAYEYIQLSKCSEANISSCKSMAEAMLQNSISRNEESEDFPASSLEGELAPLSSGPKHSKKCRLWKDSSDCEACEAQQQPTKPRSSGGSVTRSSSSGRGRFNRNSPPPPKPREPITLEQVFEHGQACLSQAKRAKIMSKKVRAIERGDIYRTATGVRSERIAESLLGAAQSLMKVAFPIACLTCKGDVNANRNSDPCEGCGGKGYLIE